MLYIQHARRHKKTKTINKGHKTKRPGGGNDKGNCDMQMRTAKDQLPKARQKAYGIRHR